jgi:hypothetical protein
MTLQEDDPAIALVRAYNAALHSSMAAGDPEGIRVAVEPFLTTDAVCNETPALPWGGKWVGGAGFKGMFEAGLAAFGTLVETTGQPPSASDPADDEYMSLGNVVIRRYAMVFPSGAGDDPLTMVCLERYTVADGLIAEIDVFFFDVPAMVDLLAPAALT